MSPHLTLVHPAPEPESADDRRAYHSRSFRELTELAMAMARAAAAHVVEAAGHGEAATAMSLVFTRATTSACQAMVTDDRLASGANASPRSSRPAAAKAPAPRSAAALDPRRAPLRDALRKAANAEPDRAARAKLCRDIDERIDEELLDDPDQEIPIVEILMALGQDFQLPLDVSKLPDEVLGIPPRPLRPTDDAR